MCLNPAVRSTRTVLVVCLLAGLVACKETAGGIKVSHLKFKGVHAISVGQLRSALATAQSSWLPWGTKHYFSRDQFEADLKRIPAFYRDRGYPAAKVTSYDVELSKDQESVDVTINIDEGQPITVEAIEYQGFDVVPPRHLKGLEERLPLKAGAPLDRALAAASRETALDEVRDHGYPYASVKLTEAPGTARRQRIITLTATPGTLARYGPIEISGNSSVSDDVIRRQLTYRPGRRFRLSQLQDSQRRLYDLETFQFANIEPDAPEGTQPALVPTKVTVTEGKHRKVNYSIGYGSEEKARTDLDWRHVNFFGGARTMEFEGRYSSLSRGVRANFVQPYLFSPRYDFTATGQSWWDSEPAYQLTTEGGKLTIARQLARPGPLSQRTAKTTLSFSYTHEYEDYMISNEALNDLTFRDNLISLGLDPRTGRGKGLLSSLSFDVQRTTADNLLDAKHGYVASLHLEQAGRALQGDANYLETVLEGRYYLNVANVAILAFRARGGAIDPAGGIEANVPFFKRYFAGGATSLRGWGRFDVSPLSGSGLPIGGFTQLVSSAELRTPVWKNLSGVAFVDAGNVWASAWDFNLNDLLYDVGPGIRYKTPIGPIRVDLGYQLNREPGLLVNGKPEPRRWRIHFSIGQAF